MPKLTLDEIRQDAELIRLKKILMEANTNYHNRIMQLFKENDIKPIEFQSGVGISFLDPNSIADPIKLNIGGVISAGAIQKTIKLFHP